MSQVGLPVKASSSTLVLSQSLDLNDDRSPAPPSIDRREDSPILGFHQSEITIPVTAKSAGMLLDRISAVPQAATCGRTSGSVPSSPLSAVSEIIDDEDHENRQYTSREADKENKRGKTAKTSDHCDCGDPAEGGLTWLQACHGL